MEAILLPMNRQELTNIISTAIENALQAHNALKSTPADTWFNLNELCAYLPDKPAPQTVYGYVRSGNIPFYKDKKKLRFLKSEIDEWLKKGRRHTQSDIDAAVDTFLNSRKRRSR